MKKILSILIVMFTVISSTSTIFGESIYTTIHSPNKDVLLEHLDVINKYKDNMYLLSKNIFDDPCNNKNKSEVHLKDIDYFIQQICSRSKALNSQCKAYTCEDPLLSNLLATDIILCEYRLSLVYLSQYLASESVDLQYKNKYLFFSVFTDANSKLASLKEFTK